MTESNPSAPDEGAISKIDPSGHVVTDRSIEIFEHPESDAPGVLIFDPSGRIVSATPNVDGYLRDLGALDSRWHEGQELPLAVQVVLSALERERGLTSEQDRSVPRLRIQTHSGRWLLLHAARTHETADRSSERIVVVAPAPEDAAWFVAAAFGLGSWKEELVRLLVRGMSTMNSIRLSLEPTCLNRCHFSGIIGKGGALASRH